MVDKYVSVSQRLAEVEHEAVFQIKNAVRAAHALAAQQKTPLSYAQLETVIDSDKESKLVKHRKGS
jgi:hypothetical protein